MSAVDRRAGGPVLFLRRAGAAAPRRVVAAVQEHDADAPVVEAAVPAAETFGARLRLVHAVPRSFGERSVGPSEAADRGRRLLEETVATTGAVGGDLVRAWPLRCSTRPCPPTCSSSVGRAWTGRRSRV
ncbi:MAG: hypothetical protein ABS80_03740 [Pseudonocardia sp. SCN 72-51]|nr:MAG: hypothetical protein ABS80_03740 [Pseudonocardia sp. SCN 72-51]